MTNPSSFRFPRRGRQLLPGQTSELTVINSDGTGRRVVFTASEIIEAPNWTQDGRYLIFNGGGKLYRIDAEAGGEPEQIDTGAQAGLNNDHVLSPDGRTVYFSDDDSHLYAIPIEGGTPKRVSNSHTERHHYYLHGVSPDGKTLAYVGMEGPDDNKRYNIFTIPVAGGPNVRLTDNAYTSDGPEYSPDGKWIYYNSEHAAKRPGHAQCFRMRPDGSGREQLTFDDRVNWFPHFSPDGKTIVYLSFPSDTTGHPPNKDVVLRTMRPDGSDQRDVVAFFGGQGTINVNSWAPDNKRFAYVAYPISKSAA